jgi:hypothetical protein
LVNSEGYRWPAVDVLNAVRADVWAVSTRLSSHQRLADPCASTSTSIRRRARVAGFRGVNGCTKKRRLSLVTSIEIDDKVSRSEFQRHALVPSSQNQNIEDLGEGFT